jgi:hypothetical protein
MLIKFHYTIPHHDEMIGKHHPEIPFSAKYKVNCRLINDLLLRTLTRSALPLYLYAIEDRYNQQKDYDIPITVEWFLAVTIVAFMENYNIPIELIPISTYVKL